MSTFGSSVKLNTGAHMPLISLGTWKSEPGRVEHAVEYSLKSAGYRGIDTAATYVLSIPWTAYVPDNGLCFSYDNEKEVGQGIIASGIPRENIFLTTKLGNADHGNVEEALEMSLKNLNTPYLDLCRFSVWLPARF